MYFNRRLQKFLQKKFQTGWTEQSKNRFSHYEEKNEALKKKPQSQTTSFCCFFDLKKNLRINQPPQLQLMTIALNRKMNMKVIDEISPD